MREALPQNDLHPFDAYQKAWERVLTRLRFQCGEANFKSWLRHLRFDSYSHGQVTLFAPTRFIREWILSHYREQILVCWREEEARVHAVDILVRSLTTDNVPASEVRMASELNVTPTYETQLTLATEENNPVSHVPAGITSPSVIADSYARIQHLSSPLDPRYTFENFVVGKPNELAHAAALKLAESDKVNPGSNPLFIYGGVGLGKTHLMHAIAWHIRKHNPSRIVVYLSAEKFMYMFINALRHKDVMTFKEQFRSVDVLLIDDVQFISGKDSTQEEFFHTFNALIDQNKQLIISGDRSPSDLEGIEERVRSRLGWGLVADVNNTTFELRLGILQAKAEQMGVDVPKDVLEFLAGKITSNVRELEGALNKVLAHSSLIGRAITLESTQEILSDLLRSKMRMLTIDDIKKRVAEHCNIRVADMHSARRARAVARPRQIAMYLAKKLTAHSLPEIGRQFGGKDHTTVMHAIRKVEELSLADKAFAEDLQVLTRTLQN